LRLVSIGWSSASEAGWALQVHGADRVVMDLGERCMPTTPDELISTVRLDELVGAFSPDAARALWVCAVDGVMIVVMDLGEAGWCMPTTPDELVSKVRLDGLVGRAFAPESRRVMWVRAVDGVVAVIGEVRWCVPTTPEELVSGIILCVSIFFGVRVVVVERSPDDADERTSWWYISSTKFTAISRR
jgi:hypothetical protein